MKTLKALIKSDHEGVRFCFACGQEYKKCGRIANVNEHKSTYECRCGSTMETLDRVNPTTS